MRRAQIREEVLTLICTEKTDKQRPHQYLSVYLGVKNLHPAQIPALPICAQPIPVGLHLRPSASVLPVRAHLCPSVSIRVYPWPNPRPAQIPPPSMFHSETPNLRPAQIPDLHPPQISPLLLRGLRALRGES